MQQIKVGILGESFQVSEGDILNVPIGLDNVYGQDVTVNWGVQPSSGEHPLTPEEDLTLANGSITITAGHQFGNILNAVTAGDGCEFTENGIISLEAAPAGPRIAGAPPNMVQEAEVTVYNGPDCKTYLPKISTGTD